MPQTVIGVFNRLSDARHAEELLMRSGFADSSVDVAPQRGDGGEDRLEDRERGDKGDAISRFFRSIFGSAKQAEAYESAARENDAIVTVHASTSEDAHRAASILDTAGAIEVEDAEEASTSFADVEGTPTATAPYAMGAGASSSTAGVSSAVTSDVSSDVSTTTSAAPTARVLEEDLHVGKGVVTTGGARLRSRIVERPVEESVRLREERVTVERHPVDRPATTADLQSFKEGEVEIVEHAEVPVVSKDVRVVEEVTLQKEASERTEVVRDTVRNTEVDVEEIQPPRGGKKPTGSPSTRR